MLAFSNGSFFWGGNKRLSRPFGAFPGLLIGAAMLCTMFVAQAGADATLTITDIGQVALDSGTTGACELSGLTYKGGGSYYAVSDSGAKLYPLTITIDSATGAIQSSSVDSAILLSPGSDLEGVAYNAANGSVYVSDEDFAGPYVREYNLAGQQIGGNIPLPAVFSNHRSNYSLESLSRQAGGASLWTANEEALNGDGELSDTTSGTLVRLQKFDGALTAAGQWAYRTEPITSYSPWINDERSGVSDLAVLPNGKFLVLERELNGEGFMGAPQFHSRIYEVEFAGATDVSSIAELEGATFTPVTKHLLWDNPFSADNFEGIALGPQLENGDYSLLLVSDDQNSALLNQSLYALRLAGEIPEPATFVLLAAGACLGLFRRSRG